ncbi:bifunctional folylpolyglutamate synthase/dihydrofolate synthase [Sporosarcina sp. G11-34]|uniref:bifunctional folylpolyglutamate synthase/dihydrofolate synthase n=1 Tax=Sporosarcina sp. G11-34 TaxID=2849605 RepID=UPI0022A8E29A|nr:folylpolyglutamate synthase/dihydrofolate synthase family protein [Sporosarcina sp. G11-34]MCZ2259815.1 bifunctional folylpolyglutamate synthase/dihydrofolate synthase [Sporosarcina sp. G11-34]
MIPKLKEYKERWGIRSDDTIKPGLEAIEKALVKLGNPEKELKVIHVTGTNGKGSTIAFMESILKEHGYTTGVFSSPAIIDIHDQIRIDGEPITVEELNVSFEMMKEAGLSDMLTDFELLTVAAFVTFERIGPDYVLLETGMGGLLDSTNVVIPLVSVITSIALDHSSFLGSTVEKVTEHKAGIIKEGTPIVTGPLSEEALQIVRRIAVEKGSLLLSYGDQFVMEIGERELFKGQQDFILDVRKMKGPHQGVNAALAIEALLFAGVALSEKSVAKGVANTQLAHRFQEISPGVFIDGAHNPAAAKALTETIMIEFPGEKVDFIIGMLKGKEIKKTLDELIPVAASFTFLSFDHPNAATGESLMKNCDHKNKSVTKLVDNTIILSKEHERRIIVTGSLYLLASLKYLPIDG